MEFYQSYKNTEQLKYYHAVATDVKKNFFKREAVKYVFADSGGIHLLLFNGTYITKGFHEYYALLAESLEIAYSALHPGTKDEDLNF